MRYSYSYFKHRAPVEFWLLYLRSEAWLATNCPSRIRRSAEPCHVCGVTEGELHRVVCSLGF